MLHEGYVERDMMFDDDFSFEVVSGGHALDTASLGRRNAACSYGSPRPGNVFFLRFATPSPANAVVSPVQGHRLCALIFSPPFSCHRVATR